MDIRTIDGNGKSYETVNEAEYVKYLKSIGAKTISAKKSGYVTARKAILGEKLAVYISNGNTEVTETAREGQWLLTRADDKGVPVVDRFGHKNQWFVDDETFRKRYDTANLNENGLAKPLGISLAFIETDRDIAIMVPWGEKGSLVPQIIDKGGFLCIDDINAVYGIAREEFFETYTVLTVTE